jgi:hypothetical protein
MTCQSLKQPTPAEIRPYDQVTRETRRNRRRDPSFNLFPIRSAYALNSLVSSDFQHQSPFWSALIVASARVLQPLPV